MFVVVRVNKSYFFMYLKHIFILLAAIKSRKKLVILNFGVVKWFESLKPHSPHTLTVLSSVVIESRFSRFQGADI